MNYREFRQLRLRKATRDRQPSISNKQDQRLLYSVHLKTIENRTLLETLKHNLAPDKFDEVIVDYAIRLRKARSNFVTNNIGKELDMLACEAELEERDSEFKPAEKKIDHSLYIE